ncbi:MAG: isochorismatase family protein [Deltaproteobacteria bacterium]|nr:isochorismatase family protein [Candidatus Zymogenaceae bacterium]
MDDIRIVRPTVTDTALVVVDFQGSLFSTMDKKVGKRTLEKTILLIKSALILDLPIVVTEQYPKGLGLTMDEIRSALGDAYRPLEKVSFSIMGEPSIAKDIRALGRRSFILCGMETHVCVMQSAVDLLDEGFTPYVAADAVCSRERLDWEAGLSVMEGAGAEIVTVETIVFALLKKAGTPEFKAFSKLLKGE